MAYNIFERWPFTSFQNLNLDWLIEGMKEAVEKSTNAEETAENLKQFVNTYFDNLDVQEEINTKIDEMVDSGEFLDTFDQLIPSIVSAWLQENITPTSPAVDASLTISGAAADAKATGDKYNNLKDEITNTRNSVYNGDYLVTPQMTNRKYIDTSGTEQNSSSSAFSVSDFIQIEVGTKKVNVHVGTHGAANQVSFYNAEKEYISGYNQTGDYRYIGITLNVPDNAEYFRLCDYSDITGHGGCYANMLSTSFNDFNDVNEHIQTMQKQLGIYPVINEGYYYRLGTPGDMVPMAGWECLKIETDTYYDIGIRPHSIVLYNQGAYVASYVFADIPNPIADVFDAIGYNISNTNYHTGDVSYVEDSALLEKVKAPSFWKGSKANFLGDSITYGAYTPVGGSSPTERASKRYCEVACEILGIATCRNYGASGTSISSTSPDFPQSAMCIRYSEMSNDADLIVVAGGTNDYGTNVPLGTIADTNDISFYGALNVLCDGLQSKYLGKRIVFITPIHRQNEGPNSIGVTLNQYRQAIRDVAAGVYGFAVIDGEQMGISCANTAFKDIYIVDGLHPNPSGHEVYGKALGHTLNTM